MTLIEPRGKADPQAQAQAQAQIQAPAPGLSRAPAGSARLARWATVPALAALLLGSAPGAPSTAGDSLAGPLPAQVVTVLDGDTLEVRVHIWLGQDLGTRVRLAGIDAPELKGKCDRERDLARRARAYLLARLDPAASRTESVRLWDVRNGKFAGRVLARVETLDGADLGQDLIAAGLARPYDGRRRSFWCEAGGTAGSG